MTPSELKQNVETKSADSHFFTRSNMKFFGDTMVNYGCRSNGGTWELWRKKPVKNGLQHSAFFDKKTFDRVFNI